MPTREHANKDLIRRAYAALNDRDRDRFADLVAADAIHHTPDSIADFHGREEYVDGEFAVFEDYPDTTYEIETILAENDQVAIRLTWRGTHYGEVVGVEVHGVDLEMTLNEIYCIENGEIAEAWTEVDLLTQLEQLGVVNDLEVRTQYLEVLNRVLRHNLRNDLGSIMGYAGAIAETLDDPTPATRIQETADQLVTLAEKARTLQTETVDRQLELRELDVAGVLQDAIKDARITASSDVSVGATAEGLRLTTDRALLETALVEILENAMVHNDAADPHVEVTASVSSMDTRTVTIMVADNGPGIPSHELEPIEQEGEGPLVHGSGIGLWAVKWAIDRLDGDLTFEGNEPRGSVVTIHIPDLEDAG